MKKQFLILLLIAFSLNIYAQKKQNVYYVKNGIPTTDIKNADFRRIIQEPDSGSNLFNIFEFYLDNTEKTIAKASKYEPKLVFEDVFQSFNEKGILIEKLNYENGKLNGVSEYFYNNGKPKKTLIYDANVKLPGVNSSTSFKITSYFDSLGNQTIKDGNGYFKEENKNGFEEGAYLNSNKDGIWKGKINDETYEEKYKDGKFISGEAKLVNGKISKYKVPEEFPDYPGGIAEFYKYIGKEFKYPKEAVTFRVNGKLYINFVIDKDGRLIDIKFKNTFGHGIEEEALRIFENSPKWNPGKQHGIPVKVKYNININLKVS